MGVDAPTTTTSNYNEKYIKNLLHNECALYIITDLDLAQKSSQLKHDREQVKLQGQQNTVTNTVINFKST